MIVKPPTKMMCKVCALGVLVAASLLVAVASEAYVPKLSEYLDLKSIDNSIGENVEGARILENIHFNKDVCIQDLCDYEETYVYPSVFTSESSMGMAITKVVVLVEETSKDQLVTVTAVNGGIHYHFVDLKISVKNAKKLNYRVVVLGAPWN